MHIYKVLPDLDKPRHLSVWHKAIRGQWSPEEIDWKSSSHLVRDDLKDRLARILTPVLMGEQAALYYVTSMIQILGRASDAESQFYLTSMAMDEARHLAFNHIFIEDHFWWRYKGTDEDGQRWAEHLERRLEAVLESVTPMLDAIADDLSRVGIDHKELFSRVQEDTRTRLLKSIESGEKRAQGLKAERQVARAG